MHAKLGNLLLLSSSCTCRILIRHIDIEKSIIRIIDEKSEEAILQVTEDAVGYFA